MMRQRKVLLSFIVFAGLVLNLLSAPGAISAQNSQGQTNKNTVNTLLDQTYGKGNVGAMDAVLTADYVRNPGKMDSKNVKVSILSLRAAIPDLKETTALVISEANFVAVRLKLEGTFKNELVFPNSAPVKPNNQPLRLTANIVYQFNDQGQITQEWDGFDDLGYLAQIGVIPHPKTTEEIASNAMEIVPTGTPQRNKKVVTSYFQALNQGDYSILQQNFSPDVSAYDPFGKLGLTGLITDLTTLRGALPNLTFNVTQLIGEGNWVAAVTEMTGTFTADFKQPTGAVIKPTGKALDVLVITLFRFNDQGAVTESWQLYDSWSFVTQLGLTPQAPAK